MSRLKSLAFAIGVLSVSAAARADEPEPAPVAPAAPPAPQAIQVAPPVVVAPDSVQLKDGGFLRGTVREVLPGGHVTLLDASGRTLVVPWGQIQSINLGARAGGGAATAVPVPGASAPASPAEPAKAGPLVRVHVESPRAAQLYRRPSQGDGGWYQACAAPCDIDLPLGDMYRVSGPGLEQSRDFTLEGSPGGRVVITVNPSTRAAYTTGAILTAVGGLVDYVGLIVLAASAASSETCTSFPSGSSSSSPSYSCTRDSNNNSHGVAAGGLILLGGTALAVAGIVMMISNNSTGVSVSSSSSQAKARPLDVASDAPGVKDAFRRDAAWRGQDVALPAPTVASFTARF